MTNPPAEAAGHLGWLLERAALSEDALPLVARATDGATVVQALMEGGQGSEAARVIAVALPPREGVWWAWVSARHAAQLQSAGAPADASITPVSKALAVTERWITSPDENGRRAAWAACEEAGLDTAAGCAAAAAYFTSGSVSPPDVPPIPPPPGLYNTLIAAAVSIASGADPERFDALSAAFIAQGLEVIRRLEGWDTAVATTRKFHDAQRERHAQATGAPAPPQGH